MKTRNRKPFKPVKKKLDSTRKSTSLIDHKAYQYYLQNKKIGTREDVAHYVEHGKLISTFYKIVSEQILESRGGVYIKGFGYFGVKKLAKTPVKRFSYKELKTKLVTSELYNIFFVPISKNNTFRIYSFDISFTHIYFYKFVNKIKEGFRYTFNASLFYNDLRKVGARI